MLKQIKKRFDISITEANKTVSKTFELDKNIKSVKGLLLTADKDDMLYFRGTQKIEINKEEIFPDNYEGKLLMSGVNVSPNQRYYNLGNVNPGNGTIKVSYTDNNNIRAPFSIYRVSLYLDCEMEDTL